MMPVTMILRDPMGGLNLPPTLELGPFETIRYEGGCFYGDGEPIAEVFEETVNDRMTSVMGHPAAGKVFVPRTFDYDERDDPEYPGKPYGRVEFATYESKED